jgi:hypothetical protein
MKALLPHSPRISRRAADYVDPPSVVARQQRILARWKAEGRIINQPRLAISLAIARQGEKNVGDSRWGFIMYSTRGGKTRARIEPSMAAISKKAHQVLALRQQFAKPRAQLAQAQLVNPYALPEKPVARSGQTL